MFQSHVKIDACVYWDGESLHGTLSKCHEYYIPLSTAATIRKCHSGGDLSYYCKFSDASAAAFTVFPLYVMRIANAEVELIITHDRVRALYAVIHPSQNERMERYLSGNDNPIRDLVTELRYNPAFLGAPLHAAEQRFTAAAASQVVPE
jgi:hypothetical protein